MGSAISFAVPCCASTAKLDYIAENQYVATMALGHSPSILYMVATMAKAFITNDLGTKEDSCATPHTSYLNTYIQQFIVA